MSPSPSQVGAVAEREVAYALSKAGHDVFVPLLAPHSRVDLVADVHSELLRIQVKSACLVGTVITFRACSNTRNRPKDYVGEIDAFGVYSPDLDRCFLVPIELVPSRLCHLRVAPPRNNQGVGIRCATEYQISGDR